MPMEDQLRAIASRCEIAALYAFGSRATEVAGRARGHPAGGEFSASDVDIGVEPAPGRRLTAQERARLAIELEDLLGVNRVHLVVLREAEPFLALDIIRGELLYCDDPDAQAEDELYVLRRAADLARYARDRWNQILTGVAP